MINKADFIKYTKIAASKMKNVVLNLPLEYNPRLSKKYGFNLYIKREDLQPVRSYLYN